MPLKKPLPLLVPPRIRRVPHSFAWIDHRLRSEGFLERLPPGGHRPVSVSRPGRRPERTVLLAAGPHPTRHTLFRSCTPSGTPGGDWLIWICSPIVPGGATSLTAATNCFPCHRLPKNLISPELQEAMARAFKHLETPSAQP